MDRKFWPVSTGESTSVVRETGANRISSASCFSTVKELANFQPWGRRTLA